LAAIVTIDEAALATRLIGTPCTCVTDDAAIRAIYDVLLNHGGPNDLDVAAKLSGPLGPSGSELAKSYDAAATFLAGAAGIDVEKAATDRFIALAERRYYEAFKGLSPHVLVVMYEQTHNPKEPLDKIIKSAVTNATINNEFTPVDDARRRIHSGRLYEAEGDGGAAIDEVKFVVLQLVDLYSKALEVLKRDSNPLGWRRGVHEKQAFETFKALIDARAYIVSLYSRAHNLKSAGRHFGELLAVEAPFPVQILVDAAVEGCRANGQLDRVTALTTLDLKKVDAKAAIAKLACFPA